MTTEIEKLKALAIKHYEIDGGVMAETFSSVDYADLITNQGTAARAWKQHLKINEARKESCGFYESF